MPQSPSTFDVIVIGAGPSGLMAAIAAQDHGAATLLIEKGNKLGRKLAISGGGRCNVTNAKLLPEFMKNIPGNPRFLYSALTRFSNEDIRRFFEELGIALKEEDRGRVFPVSDKASTVVKALVDHVYALGVTVFADTRVSRLMAQEQRITGVQLTSGVVIPTQAVVVATGGCSVPQTGSTGDAYPWAKALGHTLIKPYPTEVPLTSNAPFILNRTLQGLSFRDVMVTLINGHPQALTCEGGDILFSHFGLTGPVALRVSHYVSAARLKNPEEPLTASIDFFPAIAYIKLLEDFHQGRQTDGKKQLKTRILQWVPERLASFILAEAGVPGTLDLAQASNAVLTSIVDYLKAFSVPITGTLPLEKATVTGGGVSVRDIVPKTMASKHCRGLYFAGEVIDVHAHTGGYNITVAFSTGHLAGKSAAEYRLSHESEASRTPVNGPSP